MTVPSDAQLSASRAGVWSDHSVATKEHKRQARGLIEGLETRVHLGPPVRDAEIHSAQEFLREADFSPASDYYNRLIEIQHRLQGRPKAAVFTQCKRNYGGEAARSWMQLQSAYDHVILSMCYEGDFNQNHGRIKISHRFNGEGRIDFVELKFLCSLHPCLNGEIRKLLTIKDYRSIRKDWRAADAFVLPVLPRELIFLFEDIFRCERAELFGWLINIGHWIVGDLLQDVQGRSLNGLLPQRRGNGDQLCLQAVRTDEIAWPILEKAASLESAVELKDTKNVGVRYLSKGPALSKPERMGQCDP